MEQEAGGAVGFHDLDLGNEASADAVFLERQGGGGAVHPPGHGAFHCRLAALAIRREGQGHIERLARRRGQRAQRDRDQVVVGAVDLVEEEGAHLPVAADVGGDPINGREAGLYPALRCRLGDGPQFCGLQVLRQHGDRKRQRSKKRRAPRSAEGAQDPAAHHQEKPTPSDAVLS